LTAIDEIKNRVDVVDLISETVTLRRAGKNYTGFCPFHANTRTPAFVVFPDSGTWRCFGECNEGGDIFRFVMKKEGVDFAEALRMLAERAGVKLEPVTPQKKEEEETHQRLRDLLEEAVIFYRHHLLHHPAGKPAIDYLKNRGLTAETIESFQLGYALESWDSMIQNMLSKGYNRDDLIQVGLVSEQRDEKGDVIQGGRIYDRFRNRIMIPINDSQGNPIGFGARILNPNDSPKFLNSPQTVLFDKGKTLFGLDRAKRSIREKNQAVIVEGYLDVILLHQAGFTNTISPMGTALGEFQIKQIARQSRQIILALDADAAGDQATLKGIELMRTSLKGTEEDILAESKDLIRHENKLNTDIRITRLPAGMDPDE
jgi:DNA primase